MHARVYDHAGLKRCSHTAPFHVAFRGTNSVGIQDHVLSRLNGWPACSPYRRFANILTEIRARLGVDVDRRSFIVTDFHHLLLAGLLAH